MRCVTTKILTTYLNDEKLSISDMRPDVECERLACRAVVSSKTIKRKRQSEAQQLESISRQRRAMLNGGAEVERLNSGMTRNADDEIASEGQAVMWGIGGIGERDGWVVRAVERGAHNPFENIYEKQEEKKRPSMRKCGFALFSLCVVFASLPHHLLRTASQHLHLKFSLFTLRFPRVSYPSSSLPAYTFHPSTKYSRPHLEYDPYLLTLSFVQFKFKPNSYPSLSYLLPFLLCFNIFDPFHVKSLLQLPR